MKKYKNLVVSLLALSVAVSSFTAISASAAKTSDDAPGMSDERIWSDHYFCFDFSGADTSTTFYVPCNQIATIHFSSTAYTVIYFWRAGSSSPETYIYSNGGYNTISTTRSLSAGTYTISTSSPNASGRVEVFYNDP